MIIAIDLTSLSYHMTGIERYAACVSEKMLEQDTENEYRLIFRNHVYPVFEKFIDNKRVKSYILHGNKKVIFYQIILPWNLYKIKADTYLFFAFTSPVFFRKKGIYNTIHDMGAWDCSDAMKLFQKIYWRFTIRSSAKISKGLITVSEFSKGRISKILKYPKEKIYVINSAVYEGVVKDHGHSFNDIKKKYSLPHKYIMTLSTLEPRKNMGLLLEAFSDVQDDVNYDLVLVGRKGWKMDEVIGKYNSKERIHITGFVDDNDVSDIYRNAICFVFPSLYEGFGLPPVEALALGTPVISSNAASMPEVLMEQAVYFKNNNIDELRQLLETLENDIETMPHELNKCQKVNYTFDTAAKKILRLITDENTDIK